MRIKRVAEPGHKFGNWTVLSDAGKTDSGRRLFLCRCKCGTEAKVNIGNLYSGKSISCGCILLSERGENMPEPVAGGVWVPVAGNKWMLVDEQDAPLFEGKMVNFNGRVAYLAVKKNGKQYNHKAHRIILGLREGATQIVDHINRNPLDNRRSNLRICTLAQNNMNRKSVGKSGFKGVVPNGSGWAARIKMNRTTRHLGTYRTKEEAAQAYDQAAKSLFGEFALLNFQR